MSNIFRNAYHTMSASLHNTDPIGIFQRFDAEFHSAELSFAGLYGKPTQSRVNTKQRPWDHLIQKSPLHSRGRCFQERELSSTAVH